MTDSDPTPYPTENLTAQLSNVPPLPHSTQYRQKTVTTSPIVTDDHNYQSASEPIHGTVTDNFHHSNTKEASSNTNKASSISNEPCGKKGKIIIHQVPGDTLAKPRVLQGGKDIAFSLIPLVALCVIIAWLSGNLGMQFGPLHKKDAIPAYHADLAATAAAREFHIPIRFPDLPRNWKPNSGSKETIHQSVVQNLGWITDTGGYIQLSETSADVDSLTTYLSEKKKISPYPNLIIPGWNCYIRDDGRIIAVTQYPGISIGLSGNASISSFQLLAQRIAQATPLYPFAQTSHPHA